MKSAGQDGIASFPEFASLSTFPSALRGYDPPCRERGIVLAASSRQADPTRWKEAADGTEAAFHFNSSKEDATMTSKRHSNVAPGNPRQSDRGVPQQQQNQQKEPRHQGGQRQPERVNPK
jgi:hypothetical protein